MVVIGTSGCGSRNLSTNKLRSSLALKDKVNILTNENELYQGSKVIMITDSNDYQYKLKIFPLDTFTFSLENGFKGKASSIEFTGRLQQKTATTDSSTFAGRKQKTRHVGLVRKVESEQLASSKAISKIWLNWWLIAGLVVGIVLFIWMFNKLKGFAKR